MRRRWEPHTFKGNLDAENARLEAKRKNMQPSQQRDLLEHKLRQIKTAVHIDEWLRV